MNFARLQSFIHDRWHADVMAPLHEYISIPCVSPAFEPNWEAQGRMDEAATLLATWARTQLTAIDGTSVELLRLPERTPLLFIEIPASRLEGGEPIIIYGHLDKQPPMEGWVAGRSAWSPRLEGERLYGRGGADDGYSMFSAILAVLALHDQGLPYPRCMIIIEASEESSSEDLPFYIDHLAPRLDKPVLVVALDAMCGNYNQLWVTTSLRGQVAGTLTVRVLSEGIHSGEASGIVPSSFRIVTHLLARIEDPATGCVFVPNFTVELPGSREREAATAANVLGSGAYDAMPFVAGATPVKEDVVALLLDRSWRPQLAVTGMEGLPAIQDAAAIMQPMTALKLSLRLPPTLDAARAGHALKALLEANPPYGCHVSFDIAFTSPGWHAPENAEWLALSLDDASEQTFGKASALYGGGGGIPFLNMLGERFPDAQFLVTGVLGPQSNAHGPNEFLHIPTALNVTAVLAKVIYDAGKAREGAASNQPRQ